MTVTERSDVQLNAIRFASIVITVSTPRLACSVLPVVRSKGRFAGVSVTATDSACNTGFTTYSTPEEVLLAIVSSVCQSIGRMKLATKCNRDVKNHIFWSWHESSFVSQISTQKTDEMKAKNTQLMKQQQ